MNASRTFFLFRHGVEDGASISMTARMLGRLCDTGRLKGFEDQLLIDRATERMAAVSGAAPAAAAYAVDRPATRAAAMHSSSSL